MENYEEERGQKIKVIALTVAAAAALIAVVALGIGLVLPKHSEPNKEPETAQQPKNTENKEQEKTGSADGNKATGNTEKTKELPETGPSVMMPLMLVGGFALGYVVAKKLMQLEDKLWTTNL